MLPTQHTKRSKYDEGRTDRINCDAESNQRVANEAAVTLTTSPLPLSSQLGLKTYIYSLFFLPGGNPVESQVVLLEKTPESSESREESSAKNLDLCRQLLSTDLTSRIDDDDADDDVFGVSGNMRRLTRSIGDVGLFGGDATFGGLSDSLEMTDCDAGGDVRCDDSDDVE